ERASMAGLRRRLGALGHPVPVHQGGGGGRRPAGLPGLGARRPRRRGGDGTGMAGGRPALRAGAPALAGRLCRGRDRHPLPPHRHRRAVGRLLAGRHRDRRRAALRGAAGAALRRVGAGERSASGRPARRARRSRGAGRRRRRGQDLRAAGHRGDPDRRTRLCRRPHGHQATADQSRPARDDGGQPDRRGAAADAGGDGRPAGRDAFGAVAARDRRPRRAVHGGRLHPLRRPDRRGRSGACDGDHLRGAGRRRRAGHRRARRAAGRRRGRRAPAHHRRVVAVDRRAPSARRRRRARTPAHAPGPRGHATGHRRPGRILGGL
ncbi:MAG: Permease of the drug/metabolite transporter (DMT) superfamily, partial [uncultured Solirubrobacteraceae bacterium]